MPKCTICKLGEGTENGEPVVRGRVCRRCNMQYIIPARINDTWEHSLKKKLQPDESKNCSIFSRLVK